VELLVEFQELQVQMVRHEQLLDQVEMVVRVHLQVLPETQARVQQVLSLFVMHLQLHVLQLQRLLAQIQF
jgi:hypothetical protein